MFWSTVKLQIAGGRGRVAQLRVELGLAFLMSSTRRSNSLAISLTVWPLITLLRLPKSTTFNSCKMKYQESYTHIPSR